MQNSSRIGIFLLIASTNTTTMFTQTCLMKAIPSIALGASEAISQESATTTSLIARVVHDPDDGKAPPPT